MKQCPRWLGDRELRQKVLRTVNQKIKQFFALMNLIKVFWRKQRPRLKVTLKNVERGLNGLAYFFNFFRKLQNRFQRLILKPKLTDDLDSLALRGQKFGFGRLADVNFRKPTA